MTLKIGSLFSGYGGLDMATEHVTGAAPAWFVEFDGAPSKILAHHWPDVPNYGDVTKIDWDTMPPVDIITGGSPCQDLSAAGRRAGMTEGTRSNLWVNMREAIAHLKPQLVVWENVQGALSAKATSESDMEPGSGSLGDGGGGHLRALGRVLGDFTEIGYDTCWTTVRASDIGAPHHRARVFLIATPSDAHDERQPDDLCGGHGTEVTAVASRGQTLPDSESGGLPPGVNGTHNGPPHREVHSPRNDSVAASDSGGEALSHPDGELRHGRSSGKGEAGRGQPTDDSGVRIEWGEYAPAIRRWERIVGPAPSPTELNTKGKPRLNATFAEWMMGLPAGHVTGVPGLSRADQIKAIGNGICPQQAIEALTQLLKEKL